MSKHVLLVEDDRLSRESLAYLLRGLGHDVRACWSAEEAAEALATDYKPDVALLDIRLPGLSGDVFAVHLRKKYPSIRIVFVSGEFRLENPGRFAPDVTFLPKPLDFPRLLATLN